MQDINGMTQRHQRRTFVGNIRPPASNTDATFLPSDDEAEDDFLIIDRRLAEASSLPAETKRRQTSVRPLLDTAGDGEDEDDLLRLTHPQSDRRQDDRRAIASQAGHRLIGGLSQQPSGVQEHSPVYLGQKRPSINFKNISLGAPQRDALPPHSADSHASTTVPHSPVGVDSHYGSDTIHSNLSRYSTPDCGTVSQTPMPQSPGSSSSPNPLQTLQSNQSRRTSSHVSTASLRGAPSSAVSRVGGDKAGNLAWHELEPLDVDFSPAYWQALLMRLDSSSEWLVQSNALGEVRRLAMHHSEFLASAAPTASRRCTQVSIAQSVLAKVLLLAENLRSAVAKNAILTLNDLFLFANKEIECPNVSDAIMLCLKKASSGGQFLIEEAERTWRQIVLVSETHRTFVTLGNALSKLTKSSSVLKSKCINAVSFFCLRLESEELKLVCDHKDFPNNVLRTVFKSVGDSHPECRTAAARCLIVLINLIPGLLQKYRNALQDLDMSSLPSKIKRWDVFDIKHFYGISSLEESYQTLPNYAPTDRTQYRLKLMTLNVDLIIRHPLPIPQSSSTASSSHTRLRNGDHKMSSGIKSNGFSSQSQRANSAIPFVSRAGGSGPTSTRNGPSVSTMTQIRYPTPTRDATSSHGKRDPWIAAHLGERGIDIASVGVSGLFKEEGGDEDEPWTLTNQGRTSLVTTTKRDPREVARDIMARTPPRSRTPIDLRAITPLSRVSDTRSSTRPRNGYSGTFTEPSPPAISTLVNTQLPAGVETRGFAQGRHMYERSTRTKSSIHSPAADRETLLTQKW